MTGSSMNWTSLLAEGVRDAGRGCCDLDVASVPSLVVRAASEGECLPECVLDAEPGLEAE